MDYLNILLKQKVDLEDQLKDINEQIMALENQKRSQKEIKNKTQKQQPYCLGRVPSEILNTIRIKFQNTCTKTPKANFNPNKKVHKVNYIISRIAIIPLQILNQITRGIANTLDVAKQNITVTIKGHSR